MSSYVSFWVKNQKGQITPLFDFSRSNTIYRAMWDCGIRGGKDYRAEPFTLDMAKEVRERLDSQLHTYTNYIRDYKDKIEMVKDFKNTTLEERLAVIEDCQNAIAEYKEELNQINFAIDILILIEEIRETNCDLNTTREEKNNVIWAGIDCHMKGEKDEEK